MTDLRVSYDKLDESTRNLLTIRRELEDTKREQRDIKSALGSSHMAHAMADFADNWDYHRKKLLAKVEALGEMTEATTRAFRAADRKLGAALTTGKKN